MASSALVAASIASLLAFPPRAHSETPHAWTLAGEGNETIAARFAPPEGYTRFAAPRGSWAAWLRNLPLLPANAPVLLHNGLPKPNQRVHAAVVDIDVGKRDLQQCADAVIRLRAEYLYALSPAARSGIAFNFTSGDRAAFSRWADGWRPVVTDGRRVAWSRSGRAGTDRANFAAYLESVFTYAGSLSLAAELQPVADPRDIRPGDVFVQGGSPGHAMLVADVVADTGGNKKFLLIQSFMPAQSVHVVIDPAPAERTPWFDVPANGRLVTPEWTFTAAHLRRFGEVKP